MGIIRTICRSIFMSWFFEEAQPSLWNFHWIHTLTHNLLFLSNDPFHDIDPNLCKFTLNEAFNLVKPTTGVNLSPASAFHSCRRHFLSRTIQLQTTWFIFGSGWAPAAAAANRNHFINHKRTHPNIVIDRGIRGPLERTGRVICEVRSTHTPPAHLTDHARRQRVLRYTYKRVSRLTIVILISSLDFVVFLIISADTLFSTEYSHRRIFLQRHKEFLSSL